MICAHCEAATKGAPCGTCGEDPYLGGRYRLEQMLGQGASGITYRAVRLHDQETVAIKEMLLHQADVEKRRELLNREVRVLRYLRHPQIPSYVEDFVLGHGKAKTLCLVHQYVWGQDLDAELTRRAFDEDDVLGVLESLLPVLVYLHGRKPPVFHRDIKPSNVCRCARTGQLYLIDFGSVRDAVRGNGDEEGTTVAGTYGFMAPEQFMGQADPRTDLFGLGALGVALLTGNAPHTMLVSDGGIAWHAHAEVSRPTRDLLDALLSPSRLRRPSSAIYVLNEVRAIQRMRRQIPQVADQAWQSYASARRRILGLQ